MPHFPILFYNLGMKIKSYKKLKNNSYKITFLGTEETLLLYDSVILKYDLLLKKEISKKELDEILEENKKVACYYVALKYISFKNRTKLEIKKYLQQLKYTNAIIDSTIKMLEDQKIINDSEYLEMYIHDQFLLTKNGPKKISYKLKELGFQEEEIEKNLAKYSREEWQTRLEIAIKKKMKTYKKESQSKIKDKILYTFLKEGYRKEDIEAILETLSFPQNTDFLLKEVEKLYKKLKDKYPEEQLFYQIKGRLLNKGFTYEEITEALDTIKKSSLG